MLNKSNFKLQSKFWETILDKILNRKKQEPKPNKVKKRGVFIPFPFFRRFFMMKYKFQPNKIIKSNLLKLFFKFILGLILPLFLFSSLKKWSQIHFDIGGLKW